MEETVMIKQRIEDRPVNYINLFLDVANKEEFSLTITSFIGSLDISSFGGVDDISLISECIENEVDLSKEGQFNIVLKEHGEWEDVFWNKYYMVERITNF